RPGVQEPMKEPHHADRLQQEPDTISLRTGLLATGAFLLIGGVLSVIAWGITRTSLSDLRPGGRFPERHIDAQGRLAEVRSSLIDQTAPGLTRKRQEEEILRTYGWVDPRKRIVRIPIDQAMDLVAGGTLPEGRAKGQTP